MGEVDRIVDKNAPCACEWKLMQESGSYEEELGGRMSSVGERCECK